MHASFPCPNPACTHTFSPAAVKGAARLVCPRCGTVFQFGAGTPAPAPKPAAASPPRPAVAAPPPRPPVAPPPARPIAPPVAQPVVPVAMPVAPQAPAAPNPGAEPELVVFRRPDASGRRWRLGPLLAVLGVVLLGLLVAIWGGLWLIHFRKVDRAVSDPDRTARLHNARFDWPGKPWKRDSNIERQLHVTIAMRDPQQNNCLGVHSQKFKTRVPGESGMVDEARDKLRSYFEGLDWEVKKGEQVQLAGQPALLMEFQGTDPNRVSMSGECVMMTSDDVAYWFFTWGPLRDRELVSPHWPDLRDRLRLLDVKEP